MPGRVVLMLGIAALVGCTTPGPGSTNASPALANAAVPLATDAGFCISAQTRVTGSKILAANTVYTDYDAFVASKPASRPLETRQYVWFEDDARIRPKMISCKMKTADHIRTEYGADQVGDDTSCAALNAQTLEAVRGALSRDVRRQLRFEDGRNIVFEPDFVTSNGPAWLAPFPMLSVAPDGTLHVRSKGMRNDWLDPRLATADPRVKGTRYCHLVAPEYLRRVLLGEVAP